MWPRCRCDKTRRAYAATLANETAADDVNGDSRADIITGAGAGGGPHVRVFSGADRSELSGFFAYESNSVRGVRVAATDATGDGLAEIVTAQGPGAPPQVRVFRAAPPAEVYRFEAYPGFSGGVFVAGNAGAVAVTYVYALEQIGICWRPERENQARFL
jgi:hypothetical protein